MRHDAGGCGTARDDQVPQLLLVAPDGQWPTPWAFVNMVPSSNAYRRHQARAPAARRTARWPRSPMGRPDGDITSETLLFSEDRSASVRPVPLGRSRPRPRPSRSRTSRRRKSARWSTIRNELRSVSTGPVVLPDRGWAPRVRSRGGPRRPCRLPVQVALPKPLTSGRRS